MIDELAVGERAERAALEAAHATMALAQAAHMRFVDYRVGQRYAWRPVVAPIEAVVVDDGFRHRAGTVAPIHAQIALGRIQPIAEQGIGPADAADEFPSVRIEQQLVRIETMSVFGVVGTVHAI